MAFRLSFSGLHSLKKMPGFYTHVGYRSFEGTAAKTTSFLSNEIDLAPVGNTFLIFNQLGGETYEISRFFFEHDEFCWRIIDMSHHIRHYLEVIYGAENPNEGNLLASSLYKWICHEINHPHP